MPPSARPDDPLFDKLVQVLRRDEGWKLLPYRDSVGVLTIGCGHNLETPISNAAVLQILRDDVDTARQGLERFHWFRNLDTVRQGALINMGFNLGVAGLLGFHHLIAALERQDWDAAAAAMLDSKWAQQTGQRAERLSRQIRSGEWI